MRYGTTRAGLAGLAAALLVGTSVFAIAQDFVGMVGEGDADFTATLTGDAEVPAVETDGTGEAFVAWDEATMTLSWTVEYSGLSGPVVAAHFHGPAAEGENAGPVVDICDAASAAADAEVDADAEVNAPVADVEEDADSDSDADADAFAMVPSEDADADAGVEAEVDADAEVNAPIADVEEDADVDPDAADPAPLEGEVNGDSADGLSNYACATPDQNAEGEAEEQADAREASGESYLIGETTLTGEQAQQLSDGLWYVNLHTDAYPDGEIRGQVTAAGG